MGRFPRAVWSELSLSDPLVAFVRSLVILRGPGCVVLIVDRIKAFVCLSGGRSNGAAVGLVFSDLKEPCVNRTGPGESLTGRAVCLTAVPLEARSNRFPTRNIPRAVGVNISNHARTPYCNVTELLISVSML